MKVTNSKKAKKITGLQKLLEKQKGEFEQLENGKIKCLLTGHEFMPSEENVLAHKSSKAYKKASEAQFDISQYEDVLETHKQNENFLFCRLTGAKVPKKKTAIEKHVNCKKFKARFEQYKEQLEQEEEEELIENEEDKQQEDGEDIEEEQEGEIEDKDEKEEQQQAPPAKSNRKSNGKHHKGKKTQENKKSTSKKHSNGHQKQKKIKKSHK